MAWEGGRVVVGALRSVFSPHHALPFHFGVFGCGSPIADVDIFACGDGVLTDGKPVVDPSQHSHFTPFAGVRLPPPRTDQRVGRTVVVTAGAGDKSSIVLMVTLVTAAESTPGLQHGPTAGARSDAPTSRRSGVDADWLQAMPLMSLGRDGPNSSSGGGPLLLSSHLALNVLGQLARLARAYMPVGYTAAGTVPSQGQPWGRCVSFTIGAPLLEALQADGALCDSRCPVLFARKRTRSS